MNTLSGTEEKLISLIDRHASHLSDLANHLLLTAKLDSADLKLKREKIDLNQLIRATTVGLSHELDGHPMELEFHSESRTVYEDRKLLQMALFQILDNAAKYSSPNSLMSIALKEEAAELIISVRNEGSFIPSDEREKVFQRFYRCADSIRSASGTGIGLSVVKRIVDAHRGRAWVDSDLLHGTTFVIALPRSAKDRT